MSWLKNQWPMIRWRGTWLAGLEVARADHDIGLALQHRLDQPGQLLGQVLAVAVDHHDHVRLEVAGLAQAGVEGLALAPVALVADDGRPGRFGDRGGGVARAIVHHDHRDRVLPDLEHHAADEALFIIIG